MLLALVPVEAGAQEAAPPSAPPAPVVVPPPPVQLVAPPPPAPAGEAIPDPSKLTMPQLEFTPTAAEEDDFNKYFYFHRDNTSFEEAYADIRECDALASGSSIYMGGDPGVNAAATAQYGLLPSAVGGAIASVAMDAIFGSAARREQRRVNLRNCMGFKQYQRYGLSRDLWTAFNFEEGLGRKREPVRLQAIAIQALVASGPKPHTKDLGL
jgi:hypothetical protein